MRSKVGQSRRCVSPCSALIHQRSFIPYAIKKDSAAGWIEDPLHLTNEFPFCFSQPGIEIAQVFCFGQRVGQLISPFLKVLEILELGGRDLEFQVPSCKPERDDHCAECNHST